MRRTIENETSRFDPRGHWDIGLECYVSEGVIEYPDELDELSDDELSELATDEMRGCRWVVEEDNN